MEWLGNRITNPMHLSKIVLIAFACIAGSWAGGKWNDLSSPNLVNDTSRLKMQTPILIEGLRRSISIIALKLITMRMLQQNAPKQLGK